MDISIYIHESKWPLRIMELYTKLIFHLIIDYLISEVAVIDFMYNYMYSF